MFLKNNFYSKQITFTKNKLTSNLELKIQWKYMFLENNFHPKANYI